MTKDLNAGLKAVAAAMAEENTTAEVVLEGEIIRPGKPLTPIPGDKELVLDGEVVRSTALMPIQRGVVPVGSQMGRCTEDKDAPEDGWDGYDFLMMADVSNLFSDIRPPAAHAEGRFPGFCVGCGAHHVRAHDKMLCVECDADFRDMG